MSCHDMSAWVVFGLATLPFRMQVRFHDYIDGSSLARAIYASTGPLLFPLIQGFSHTHTHIYIYICTGETKRKTREEGGERREEEGGERREERGTHSHALTNELTDIHPNVYQHNPKCEKANAKINVHQHGLIRRLFIPGG